ncbi:MAG TPA: SRPBCC family protein [Dehalococcoidia bacterium]|nr:SRPBCC family protein [Dehalococcoidia bacterium]
MHSYTPDPKLDLVLERTIDVPTELVWEAWTRPEHLRNWFTPAPWTVADCEVDLRPGGIFRFIMRSPEGQEEGSSGCFLEVTPGRRLVWTDALLQGYRPAPQPFLTAVISMQPEGNGTRYTAMAMHRDEETRQKHEEMGFYDGWGTVLDQLIVYAKTMRR